MENVYQGFEDFGKRAPADMAHIALDFGEFLQIQARNVAKPYSRAVTPVGGMRTKDRHVGRLKSGWNERGAPGGGRGRALILFNSVEYAAIINRGRKRGVTPKGEARATSHKKGKPHPKAKMLGSPDARSGLSRPTVKYVMSLQEAIVRKAIQQLEAKASAS